jgi:hypothetical protein
MEPVGAVSSSSPHRELSEIPFDPLTAFRVLLSHQVRFVLIGGYAAALRGSPVITGDLDLCYARDRGNLERLASALHELHARMRGPGVPDDLPFRPDAETLEAGDHFTFQTSTGALDIMGAPRGTTGFKDLDAQATEIDVGDVTVRVASLDDLIRMKQRAARPKDLIHLEWLQALRQEIEREEG